MAIDRSIEEPCEVTSLMHGSGAERRGRLLRLGNRLEPDGKHITFADGCGIGRLRLIGSRDLATRPIPAINRVRLIRRADGYYCQVAVQAERHVEHLPTGKHTGIDLGLKAFLTDAQGSTVANSRHLRKAEKKRASVAPSPFAHAKEIRQPQEGQKEACKGLSQGTEAA